VELPYTDRLLNTIENANEEGKGYYEGLYENGDGPIKEFTANNNGIMLEALLFKKEGNCWPSTPTTRRARILPRRCGIKSCSISLKRTTRCAAARSLPAPRP
jgi:hypothetical protein